MMRIPRALLRALALLLLAALLVGVPVVVFRLVGVPLPGADELRDAWHNRQIGGELVVRVGAGVFALLWAWFTVTALAELWQVMAWHFGGPGIRLAPLPPGPSGWVRWLVRFILVSSVSVTATFGNISPLTRAATSPPVHDRASTTASWVGAVVEPSASSPPSHRAVGRETPYSLAAKIGRPELRGQIIELNLGRVSPDGVAWQGGVFPAGMDVVLPKEQVVPTPQGPAHEVVSGDSYWQIADDHLSNLLLREPTPQQVFEYTETLVSFNHELLGHRDPTLIVPGDLVVLTDTGATLPSEPFPGVVVQVDVVHEVSMPDVRLPSQIINAPPDRFEPPTGEASGVPLPVEARPEVLGPRVPAASSTAVATDSSVVLPYAAGLATALMMSAGAVGLLETRRRRQLRAATVGARLSPYSAERVQTEILLRSLSASERLARLDLALRSAAPDLASQATSVLAAVMYDTGDVCLFLRGCATPADPEWALDIHANTWRLSGATSLSTLAQRARLCAQPCPAMVHLGGVAEGGELFVDLEAVGTLAVQSPHATAILRNIAASLAVSPFLEAARLFTVGLGDVSLGTPNSEPVDSLDAALDAAAMVLGSTAQLAREATTFGLRTVGAGGEAWEPAVVVAAGESARSVLQGELRTAAAGGRGLAVVVDTYIDDAAWQLSFIDGRHVLEPLGLVVQPVGLSESDVAAVAALLDEAAALPIVSVLAPIVPRAHAEPFAEPDWALLVRVLGQVQVTAKGGAVADFERSKATELVVWLSQHRQRPTRTSARTALWDLDVRDATFANVVSDARRAMARAIAPGEGEEWIARTLTEDLPLHPRVITDADLLALRIEHARGLMPLDAIEVIRPGVELCAGMPFAGTSYLWTDAEGITSSLILLATGAAIELANHYLSLGDVDGVFWATGQGLKVLSGHEELISLRMRAHARRGDLAGVRSEWESYERAIAADPWAAAEPAPKLVGLRRELLSPGRTADTEHA